jgi:hypothetical protein
MENIKGQPLLLMFSILITSPKFSPDLISNLFVDLTKTFDFFVSFGDFRLQVKIFKININGFVFVIEPPLGFEIY